MLAIEYFEVECPEPLGATYYKQITNDVLLDHNLLRVINKLHVFIDPKVPIFVAVGTLKKITSVVRVRDFASVNPVGEKITLVISDERYLAPMLKIFWQKFGKDKIEQPDRFTVILYNVDMDAREIEDLVVADPSESLFKDLIYALRLIAPEGFRVRSEKFSKEKFSFVASEDTLAEDLNPLISEKFSLIGERP